MKTTAKIIIVFSALGFLNALFLFILFLQSIFTHSNVFSVCNINEVISCTGALNSPIAQILGLPVGVIAIFVYPVLGSMAYWALHSKKPQKQYFVIAILSGMGLTMNMITNYNEYHFLHSICLICLLCLFLITTIFISAIIGFYKNENLPNKAASVHKTASHKTVKKVAAPKKKPAKRSSRK